MKWTLRLALGAGVTILATTGAVLVEGWLGRLVAAGAALAAGVTWAEFYLANVVERHEAILVQRIGVLRRLVVRLEGERDAAHRRAQLLESNLAAAEEELRVLRPLANGRRSHG